MGRGREFSPAETQLLLDNYDKTIAEIEQVLLKHEYVRSRKSINRKLEKMREDGEVGLRSKDTVKRAYKQRKKLPETSDSPSFSGGSSFGDSSFGGGSGWDDDNQG